MTGAVRPAVSAANQGASQAFLRAEALAASLPPLLVAADRVAATVSQGVHGRRRVGSGETFWQFRHYQPGDTTQRIDWRQSAKTQRVYIRQTEWEAAQSVWLWRDASASMHYRSAARWPTKLERAELLVLATASLLARGGEHLALLGEAHPPAPGRSALHRIADVIESGRTATRSLPSFEPLPRHARVVIIGDFLLSIEEIKATITAFAGCAVRGHLLQILDPAEESLPFSGRVRFQGTENDGETEIGRVQDVRTPYQHVLDAHRRAIDGLARSFDWTFAVHHTDRAPQPALLSLFLALSETGDRR